jgi:hypothetical protein
MYKRLAVVLLGLTAILAVGVGVGAENPLGMFTKIIIGLMIVAVLITSVNTLYKKIKQR